MSLAAIRTCVLSIVVGSAYVTSAAAWENDVHYGLTKWLAQQAGFTEEQATWIADGDVGIDKSRITEPVHTTIFSACIGSDTTGSGQVHDHHFPSDRSVPNAPNLRVVRPGYVQQGGNAQSAPQIHDYRDQSRFRELGEYLHAFQDTWSHQGQPDFPPLCDEKLGWGHAFDRGGWACHLADLTYHWRDKDVLPMAKATYDALVAQTPGSAKNWDDVKPKVEAFALARSKWEKDAWFDKEKLTDRGFLQEISLPDCIAGTPCPGPYPFQRLLEKWPDMYEQFINWRPPSGTGLLSPPIDVVQLFRDFSEGMIRQRENLQAQFVDKGLATFALLRALHVSGSCPALYEKLLPDMLGAGFINGWAARQPTELCELAFRIAQTGKSDIPCDLALNAAQESRPVQIGADLQQMAKIAGQPLYFFTTSFNPKSESYMAFVRFIHLPRDILMLTARRVGDVPKITGVVWVPDQ